MSFTGSSAALIDALDAIEDTWKGRRLIHRPPVAPQVSQENLKSRLHLASDRTFDALV
jgi:hypothetical protein